MNYRYIYDTKISPLCFGSSMFVSGKIRPNANSEIGKNALNNSLINGINLIHSNFKVKTSWAIKEVLKSIPSDRLPYHLIKIELPLSDNHGLLRDQFIDNLVSSINDLGIFNVFAIIYEIDSKRTPRELYNCDKLICQNFISIKTIFDEIKNKYILKYLFHNAKTDREIVLSLAFNKFNGYTSYFNLVETWIVPHLDTIYQNGKIYLAMSPYKKGELVENRISDSENFEFVNERIVLLKEIGFDTYPIQRFILRYILAHPVVKSVIIGITRPNYLNEIIEASINPFSITDFNNIKQVLSG